MRLSAWRFCCVVLEKRHFKNLRAAHVDDPHGGCGAHSGPLTQGSSHVFIQGRPLVREKYLPPPAASGPTTDRPSTAMSAGALGRPSLGPGPRAASSPRPATRAHWSSARTTASAEPCSSFACFIFGVVSGIEPRGCGAVVARLCSRATLQKGGRCAIMVHQFQRTHF